MQFWPKLEGGRRRKRSEREKNKSAERVKAEKPKKKNTKHNWELGKLSTKKPHYQMEMWHKRL